MSKSSKTKNIFLAVIALALVGILAVMVIQMNEKTPSEKVADSISEAASSFGEAAKKAVEKE